MGRQQAFEAARQGFNQGVVTAGELATEASRAGYVPMSNVSTRTSLYGKPTLRAKPNLSSIVNAASTERVQPSVQPANPETATTSQTPNPSIIPHPTGERSVVSGPEVSSTPNPVALAANNVIYGGVHHHYHGGGEYGKPGGQGHFDSDYHLLHPELNHPLTRSMKAGQNLGNAVVKVGAGSDAASHQHRQLGNQRKV